MIEPVLYSFRRCPYAMRARLALAISGTRYELREVKLSSKPAAMLSASPKGTVPVFVQADGETIEESLGIMHAALARKDPEDWLERNDVALIAFNDGRFKYDLDRYKYPERYGVDALMHRASGLEFLQEVEERLKNAPYLSGSTRGLTDAAIVPFVRQFAAVNPDWFGQELARVQQWLSDYLASSLFAEIMVRVPPWSPGDSPVFVPVCPSAS